MPKKSPGNRTQQGGGAMADRNRYARRMKVFEDDPLRKSESEPSKRNRPFRAVDEGPRLWHDMSATQPATPIPQRYQDSVGGNRMVREIRRKKGMDGY